MLAIKILIKLSSRLICEAVYDYLKKIQIGIEIVIANSKKPVVEFSPDAVLVDINNINQKLFSQYPESKVVLIDTGVSQKNIIATIISYKISGVLSIDSDPHLFKKALKVICSGEVWLDNSTVKALLHSEGLINKNGKINGLTPKEREVISCLCDGFSNKEISSKLYMSEQTVKAHLNRLFRKLNVSSRTQLVALSINNHII